MAITYTITECETNILALDAKLLELASLPTSGTIGEDTLNLAGAYERARSERDVWVQRLEAAYQGGHATRVRRVV